MVLVGTWVVDSGIGVSDNEMDYSFRKLSRNGGRATPFSVMIAVT